MLTYDKQVNPANWMTMNTHAQNGGGLINGYALILGRQPDNLRQLTALLWEHGVPAYAASGVHDSDKTVAARGAPAFILLHLDNVEPMAIVELEEFRMRHNVPLLCIVSNAARQPHVQALMQMATDFVIAPYDSDELLLRIRRVCAASRQTAAPRDAYGPMQSAVPKTPPSLSVTEAKLLERLAETIGEPVHLDELADLIPGDSHEARIKLLRVHIFRLRQKIEPSPKNPTYLRTVRDYGYYLTQKVDGIA